MKKLCITLSVLLLIACNQKAEYTEQEKKDIELKVYETLRESGKLIDSLKEVDSDLKFQSTAEISHKAKIAAFMETAQAYRDSLNVSINEAEPNYEEVMGQLYNWYRKKYSYMRFITLSTEEFEKAKNAQ